MKRLFGRVATSPVWVKAASVCVIVLVVGFAVAFKVALQPSGSPTGKHPAPKVTSHPTPVSSPTPTSVAATLTCRLPISNGQSGSGGFISFPQATFAADAHSAVTVQGIGGTGGLDYDRAEGKWLPVSRSAVSPDGSRYAYWDYRTDKLEAVLASNGGKTSLGPLPNGPASAARLNTNFWTVIEATDAGVYAAPGGGYPASSGLWLFPWSGTGEQLVTEDGYWQAVGGGAAWGTVTPSVPEGASNIIRRLDLVTGKASDWFSVPGLQSRVVGFDVSGDSVVQASSNSVTEAWLVSGQNQGTKLLSLPPPTASGPNRPARATVQSVVGDSTGIWLATSNGLYLATASGTQQVSAVTGQLGGGCA